MGSSQLSLLKATFRNQLKNACEICYNSWRDYEAEGQISSVQRENSNRKKPYCIKKPIDKASPLIHADSHHALTSSWLWRWLRVTDAIAADRLWWFSCETRFAMCAFDLCHITPEEVVKQQISWSRKTKCTGRDIIKLQFLTMIT